MHSHMGYRNDPNEISFLTVFSNLLKNISTRRLWYVANILGMLKKVEYPTIIGPTVPTDCLLMRALLKDPYK